MATSAERLSGVRNELRQFLSGTTQQARPDHSELIHVALRLLKNVPAAKDACLEYLCSVFDHCTAQFFTRLEEGEEASDSPELPESQLVSESLALLSEFMTVDPQTWGSTLASWTLTLLGKLSARYSGRTHVPHSADLTDAVQLWMTCPSTRALLQLTVQCVRYNTDICIRPLLDTSSLYSPHFDWVVAHVGSCFPQTIISRMLYVGVSEFCEQSHSTADETSSKLKSIIQIIDHLGTRNSAEINAALTTIFQDCFVACDEPGLDWRRLATVPFLLKLSSLSPTLLNGLTSITLKTVDAGQLEALGGQLKHWVPRYFPTQEALLSLVAHLVLRCDRAALYIVQLLLRSAAPDSALSLPVRKASAHIMERVLCELQRLVSVGRPGGCVADVPLLATLQDSLPQLTNQLAWQSPAVVYSDSRAVRLLATSAVCRGPSAAAHTVSRLLELPWRLHTALRLLRALETAVPDAFAAGFRHAVAESRRPGAVLGSAVRLLRWERRCAGDGPWLAHSRLALAVADCPTLLLVSARLSAAAATDPSTADSAVQLLSLLELPDSLPASSLIALAETVADYLFCCLRQTERGSADEAPGRRRSRLAQIQLAQQMLARLSAQPVCLPAVLRCLLHTALQKPGTASLQLPDSVAAGHTASLLRANRRLADSITVPLSHTSVFHAGVIGAGPRPQTVLDDDATAAAFEDDLLLQTVGACVSAARAPDDAARTLALLLVELVSPDVMFNGLPWPDEEFTKVTVERDLLIRRVFDSCRLVWRLLELVALRPPALCYCSVLLRALAATLIQFWSNTQEPRACSHAGTASITARLLHVMCLGRLLPPPFPLLADMVQHISSYEVYLLLTDVWLYMRETVPSPAAFTSTSTGAVTRIFAPLEPRMTRNMLLVLQNNIASLGHLFPRIMTQLT